MKVVTLNAEAREAFGSAESRRTRRAGRLPGVIYGEGGPPRHVTVGMREFAYALDHGARVLDLVMEDVGEARVLLKDLQWDALGRKLLHADFLRLRSDQEIDLAVPVELIGVPKGLSAGGILATGDGYLTVRCLPANIPEKLTLRVAELELGSTLYASDVDLPENVVLAADPRSVVVSVAIPRGVSSDDEEAEEADDESAESEG